MLKQISFVVLGLLVFLDARATITNSLPYYDAFNYPEGNLAANGAPNWSAGGSSTTSLEIAVSNSAALTAPAGFPAAAGKGVRRAPSGTARRAVLQYTSVPALDGNTMYVSFLLNIQTNPASAQLIAHLDDTSASDGSPSAGIFVDNGPKVGIGKNSSSPGFTMATNLGSGTHLVIARYTFQTNNDKVDLWVDPPSSDYGAASAPASLGSTSNSGDPASLDYLQIITSSGVGSLMFIDEFRLGTTWASVVPSGGTPPPPTNSTPYITNALMTPDEFELRGTNGTPNAFYHVVASSNLALPQTSWPRLATNVFDSHGNFDFSLASPASASQFFRLLSPGGGTPPSIATQPQDQTVVAGQNATFTASASGNAPLSYQWYFKSDTLPDATNATLVVTNAQTDDVGAYSLTVSNSFGLATSDAAQLTVIVPPSITTQPQDQTLSSGQEATFNVVATGGAPLHYQWYFNTNTLLTTATNTTLLLTNIQSASAGKYSVIVTNTGGSVTSVLAVLTVNSGPTAPSITTSPQDQTVTAGQNATFTVAATGTLPLRYQWYFNTNTFLNSYTNTSLTVTNAQTNNAGFYSVIVTNNYGSATSSLARLTVNIASTNTGMVGYVTVGYTPTGGAGGTTQTVTTATAFKTAVTSTVKMVIYVQGTIDVRSISSVNMKIGNKTIIGLGTNATILGDLGIKHSTNVIVRNIFFTNPGTGNGSGGAGDGDGVTIQYADHVWVDHCTFTDCADGSCDITHASDFITVSWCKFNYTSNALHNFVNLIGHSDNNAAEDTGKLHITFVHNWWSTLCVERMPRTRFGRVHVFNNYANCAGNNYCVRASIQSEVLVENNFYENINSPYQYYAPNGLIRAVGNKTVNCSSVGTFTDTVFTPAYSYSLETPDTAKANILSGAGAGTGLFP